MMVKVFVSSLPDGAVTGGCQDDQRRVYRVINRVVYIEYEAPIAIGCVHWTSNEDTYQVHPFLVL